MKMLSKTIESLKGKHIFSRYRTIDSRAKFLLIKDDRLMEQKYQLLWKKLINVVFIRRRRLIHHTSDYDLFTVGFPPTPTGPIVLERINAWKSPKTFTVGV